MAKIRDALIQHTLLFNHSASYLPHWACDDQSSADIWHPMFSPNQSTTEIHAGGPHVLLSWKTWLCNATNAGPVYITRIVNYETFPGILGASGLPGRVRGTWVRKVIVGKLTLCCNQPGTEICARRAGSTRGDRSRFFGNNEIITISLSERSPVPQSFLTF